MTRNQFIKTVLWRDLKKLFLHPEIALLGRHLLYWVTIFILLHKLETVVRLYLHDINEPVEGI